MKERMVVAMKQQPTIDGDQFCRLDRELAQLPDFSSDQSDKKSDPDWAAALWLRGRWQRELERIWRNHSAVPILNRVELTTALLDRIFLGMLAVARQRFGKVADRIALVAGGSYASGGFVPGSSDFDGKLLYEQDEQTETAARVISKFSCDLFNGRSIGFLPSFEEAAWREDPESLKDITLLLEARFIGGNQAVWSDWRRRALTHLAVCWQDFVRQKRREWNSRYVSNGCIDEFHRREPNLKRSLRDFDTVRWVGAAVLLRDPTLVAQLAELTWLPRELIWQTLHQLDVLDIETMPEVERAHQMLLRTRAAIAVVDPTATGDETVTLRIAQYERVARLLGYAGSPNEAVGNFLAELRSSQEVMLHFASAGLRRISAQLDPPIIVDRSEAGLPAGFRVIKRQGTVFTLAEGWRTIEPPESQTVVVRHERALTVPMLTELFDLLGYVAASSAVIGGTALDLFELLATTATRDDWRRLRVAFGQYLTCTTGSLAYGLRQLRFLRVPGISGGWLAKLIPSFGGLLHRRHLDPPHRLTGDLYALANMTLGEEVLFGQAEPVDSVLGMLQTVTRLVAAHIKGHGLVRALRLILLLHPLYQRNGRGWWPQSRAKLQTLRRLKRALQLLGISSLSREGRLIIWVIFHQASLLNEVRCGTPYDPKSLSEYFRRQLKGDPDRFSLLAAFTVINQAVRQPDGFHLRLPAFSLVLGISPDHICHDRTVDEIIEAARQAELAAQEQELREFQASSDIVFVKGPPDSGPLNKDSIGELLISHKLEAGQDRPGILARIIAPALTAAGVTVEAMAVGLGPHGTILDRFAVRPVVIGSRTWPVIAAEVKTALTYLLTEEMQPGQLIATLSKGEQSSRLRFPRPVVDIETEITFIVGRTTNKPTTILRIATAESPALLWHLSMVPAACEVNIGPATMDHEGDDPNIPKRSVYTFYLDRGGKPLSARDCHELEARFRYLLNQPALEPWMCQLPERW